MLTERPKSLAQRDKLHARRLDDEIATIAARQHELITRAQLGRIGIRPARIHRWVTSGRLHRQYKGVFSLNRSIPTAEGRLLAPVLACGAAAVASHRSSLVVWRVVAPRDGPIDITVPTGRGRCDPRIRAHRNDLPPGDRTRRNNIPVTTVARSLIDYAAAATERELEQALSEARFFQLIDPASLAVRLQGLRGRRGIRNLRVLLEPDRPITRTRSELEERMLELIAAAGPPRPLVNHRIETASGPLEVDFCWPEQRLIIETDGRAAHDDAARFERDRRRDQLLGAAGWRVYRFTWHQVVDQPEQTIGTIRALLRIP